MPSYYPWLDSRIIDKLKLILKLSIYPAKRDLEHATGVDTSSLDAKGDFVSLKSKVAMLKVNRMN